AVRVADLDADVAAGFAGIDVREPIEQGGELAELVLVVARAHELADLPRMSLVGLAQLVAAGLRQDGIGDATIARALLAPHEAVAREAVERRRPPAGGQRGAARRTAPPHPAVGRSGEEEKCLVGIDRQAVIGVQLSAEPTRHGDARAHEANERVDLYRG